MKLFILVLTTIVLFSCNDNSQNASETEDSVTIDSGYVPMTDSSPSNGVNDTVAYGTADSARR